MNKKLLLKVKERILNETRPVVMSNWFSVKQRDAAKNWEIGSWIKDCDKKAWIGVDLHNGMTQIPDKDGIAEHGCQTAGCIAGHAIIEKFGGRTFKSLQRSYPEAFEKDDTGRIDNASFDILGQIALDLDEDAAGLLFDSYSWPEVMGDKYREYMGHRQYKKANQVVAMRIDWFLLTGE